MTRYIANMSRPSSQHSNFTEPHSALFQYHLILYNRSSCRLILNTRRPTLHCGRPETLLSSRFPRVFCAGVRVLFSSRERARRIIRMIITASSGLITMTATVRRATNDPLACCALFFNARVTRHRATPPPPAAAAGASEQCSRICYKNKLLRRASCCRRLPFIERVRVEPRFKRKISLSVLNVYFARRFFCAVRIFLNNNNNYNKTDFYSVVLSYTIADNALR